MFKKTISILMAVVFALSLMPFGVMADVAGESTPVTRTINFTKPAHASSNYNVHKDVVSYSDNVNKMINYGNKWYAYVQLDLTGYEEILDNENTKLQLCVKGINKTYPVKNYEAYAVNDSIENYDDTAITYQSANSQGLHDFSKNAVMIASDGNVTSYTESISVVDAEALKSVLSQSEDNSIVTIVFNGTDTANGRLVYTKEDCGLVVTYVPSEIDNEEYVSTLLESVSTLKDLTGDDDITKTGLPKTYRGMNVTWSSSDTDYITSDGVVTQHPEAKVVTLTATFSYKGIHETAEPGTAIKEFTVNVPAETPVEVRIPFTNYAFSRDSSNAEGSAAADITYKYATYSNYDCIQVGGSYDSYAQLDLKGYEEILNNPSTTATVSFEAGYQYTDAVINPFKGTISPDSADVYSNNTITWNIANGFGMHNETNPVLFELTETNVSRGNCSTGNANMQVLKDAINSSSNSIISLHFDRVSDESKIRISSENSGLFISYYKSEIDDDAFFEDIQSSFAWENITSDAQEALVNKLPTYYKGADIVWSSQSGYVTSSGELAIPSDRAIVSDVLTAQVTYKGETFTSEEFNVTICNGSLILGTPALTVEDGVASGEFAVTNATGEDISYILYLAEYNGGEMVNLVPKTIKAVKGRTTSETINANVATGNKVKFLVWKADGITPAIAAIEK